MTRQYLITPADHSNLTWQHLLKPEVLLTKKSTNDHFASIGASSLIPRTLQGGIPALQKTSLCCRMLVYRLCANIRVASHAGIPIARYVNPRRHKPVYRLCFLKRTGTRMPESYRYRQDSPAGWRQLATAATSGVMYTDKGELEFDEDEMTALEGQRLVAELFPDSGSELDFEGFHVSEPAGNLSGCQQTVQLPPVPKPIQFKQTTSPKTTLTRSKNVSKKIISQVCILCCVLCVVYHSTVLCQQSNAHFFNKI